MEKDNGYPFQTLSIRPHWLQYCINQIKWSCVCGILYGLYFVTGFAVHIVFAYLATALLIYLILEVLGLARVRYIVTKEQIIYLHGLFSHKTDYMELYRVIDYQQHRTLMQQFLGLKDVTIMSGDRNLPNLEIIGVRVDDDIVGEIRRRVEYNKKINGIYEITNRM